MTCSLVMAMWCPCCSGLPWVLQWAPLGAASWSMRSSSSSQDTRAGEVLFGCRGTVCGPGHSKKCAAVDLIAALRTFGSVFGRCAIG